MNSGKMRGKDGRMCQQENKLLRYSKLTAKLYSLFKFISEDTLKMNSMTLINLKWLSLFIHSFSVLWGKIDLRGNQSFTLGVKIYVFARIAPGSYILGAVDANSNPHACTSGAISQ